MNALWEVDWLHFEQMDVSVGDFESQFRQIDRADGRWKRGKKQFKFSERRLLFQISRRIRNRFFSWLSPSGPFFPNFTTDTHSSSPSSHDINRNFSRTTMLIGVGSAVEGVRRRTRAIFGFTSAFWVRRISSRSELPLLRRLRRSRKTRFRSYMFTLSVQGQISGELFPFERQPRV